MPKHIKIDHFQHTANVHSSFTARSPLRIRFGFKLSQLTKYAYRMNYCKLWSCIIDIRPLVKLSLSLS